jgi:hypothetical protein
VGQPVRSESENRCANRVKLIDEKIVEMDKDPVVRMWAEK